MMFVNVTGESAESLKSKFRKVAIHLTKDKYFGVEDSQVPLVIIQTPDSKKYLKANVVVEEIESWMKDFKTLIYVFLSNQGRKENFKKKKGPNANSLRAHGTEYNQTYFFNA
ncbi:unnamed protein product [Brassica rapa subsp. trilocularis]